MRRVTNSPTKYVQGKDELRYLREWCATLGRKGVFAVVDATIMEKYGNTIGGDFAGKTPSLTMEGFGGECTIEEIDRLKQLARVSGCDVIAGIGGGKTLDTAKAIAFYMNIPVVVVPTAASTDAPCSALSVIYKADGEFDRYLSLKRSPDIVLVDSDIVAKAPVRLLVAGMGDALATFYEARACFQSRAETIAGGVCTSSALALARTCRDNLFTEGYKAMLAADAMTLSIALETIIETNTYMSGIGFESGGLAAAHAIHDGLTVLPELHSMLHGEKVAFGTIVQLVLENAQDNEIFTVMDFCRTVGLPTTFAALGIENVTPEQLVEVAEASCADGKTMKNMHIPVEPDDVVSALVVADRMGR